ncbi:MAG: hypothetical protein KF788_15820 [Piscinibacter sp.]|nr:hypothetical protein [Piscinibacter sp.]
MASPPLTPADKDADRHAWAMLQRARPTVDWDKSTLRRADLTGEGQWSRVMAGHDDERHLYVGVVRPGREGPTNPHVVVVGDVKSLSLGFHKLERPEQCCALDDTPLEGCRPRRGKSGLTLTVDGATVTRLYWNGPAKRFDVTPGRLPSE